MKKIAVSIVVAFIATYTIFTLLDLMNFTFIKVPGFQPINDCIKISGCGYFSLTFWDYNQTYFWMTCTILAALVWLIAQKINHKVK